VFSTCGSLAIRQGGKLTMPSFIWQPSRSERGRGARVLRPRTSALAPLRLGVSAKDIPKSRRLTRRAQNETKGAGVLPHDNRHQVWISRHIHNWPRTKPAHSVAKTRDSQAATKWNTRPVFNLRARHTKPRRQDTKIPEPQCLLFQTVANPPNRMEPPSAFLCPWS
jgi:hypothetical protein